MSFSSLRKAPSVHEKIMADRELMVAGPFMVMNSDARHPKEFSTENTLGGNFVLPPRHWLPSVRFGLFAVNGDCFFSRHRAPLAAIYALLE
jgi:hypothetical protein